MKIGFLGSVDEIPAILRALAFDVKTFPRGCSPTEARALDLLIVAGWGRVLDEAVFDAPTLGTWNVHPSMLPARRGADALRWAFLEGDERFGVTIHQMVRAVDAGPLLWSTSVERTALDTYARMTMKLMALAASAFPALIATAPVRASGPLHQVLPPASLRVPGALQRIDPALDATTLQRRIAAFDDRAPSLRAAGRVVTFHQSICVQVAAQGQPGLVFGVDGARIAFHVGEGALLGVATPGHGVRAGDILMSMEGG